VIAIFDVAKAKHLVFREHERYDSVKGFMTALERMKMAEMIPERLNGCFWSKCIYWVQRILVDSGFCTSQRSRKPSSFSLLQ